MLWAVFTAEFCFNAAILSRQDTWLYNTFNCARFLIDIIFVHFYVINCDVLICVCIGIKVIMVITLNILFLYDENVFIFLKKKLLSYFYTYNRLQTTLIYCVSRTPSFITSDCSIIPIGKHYIFMTCIFLFFRQCFSQVYYNTFIFFNSCRGGPIFSSFSLPPFPSPPRSLSLNNNTTFIILYHSFSFY